ncbi:MAG: MFS transporter [Caldilineaceae bacterium]|jgi:FSR family fosmidomycin resistance protein-like MFS transporter
MTQTIASQAKPTAVPAVQPDTEFQTGEVFTVAGGHFVHDSFGAFLAPLLPLIRDALGTSYTGAGGLAIFTQLPSLLTPFIGYLADRISVRYFVILAPATTATLMSLIGYAPDYMMLVLLLLAVGVSIAAFHAPAPAMVARTSGNRVGMGMSIFMASGELGRTIGPLLVMSGVALWGMDGLWRLAILGWLTSGVLYWGLHSVAARPAELRALGLSHMWPTARRVFPVLAWIMGAKISMVVAITTYLPIFMSDEENVSLWLAAAALTILEGAGVAGALLTGTLSDRFGRSRVLYVLLTLSPVFMLLMLYGPGWLSVALLIALGLTAISPTPVMLAIVQDQFPDNRAVANGIFMSLNFLLRAGAILIVGTLADRFGLTWAFTAAALAAFASIPAVYFLPRKALPAD